MIKKNLARLCAAILLVAATAVPAAAQFRFGPKVGVAINSMSFNKDAILSSDNRCGFTAGLMADFTVPLIGVGADLSVMYVHRSTEVLSESEDANVTDPAVTTMGYDYISIPLHLKYTLSLPIAGNVIAPYIFTGPNFAFRCSKEIISDYSSKKYDIGWDLGIGVQLFSHLQVGAGYTWGMTKTLNYLGAGAEGADINGKTNGWTVTAAYLF
jgi:hypothetical protein